MTAAAVDLTIEQGATWTHAFIVNQPAPPNTPVANLVPMNLSGYTARMQIRKYVNSAQILLELTTENTRKAGMVRAQFITVAPGQTATYILKQDQAQAFEDGGYPQDDVPPLVMAESVATGEIERIRRSAKIAITTATTPEDAHAAFYAGVSLLGAYIV